MAQACPPPWRVLCLQVSLPSHQAPQSPSTEILQPELQLSTAWLPAELQPPRAGQGGGGEGGALLGGAGLGWLN